MTDRHIPPWDEPVCGYDAGSIGEHFLHRYVPELFQGRDSQRIGEVCRAIKELLEDANEYGAAQVRYKFLCPKRCAVYSAGPDGQRGDYLGAYWECRFCREGTTGYPDEIDHRDGCLLIARANERTIIVSK